MRRRLAKYEIPEPILAGWEKRYGGRLLPLQYRAIEEYGLLEGTSLLISAPTSSGKTFCGEMALIGAVQKRRKGIFLVPLKAVAEEKFRQFDDCYGAMGLKVVIATRDHPEHDSDIAAGRFDLAVMVYEKFNSLLLTNFDLLRQVGALVVDELQMLGDIQRGAQLELALAKLLYSDQRPQLVALSAVLGEAGDLAEWLGCRLLAETARPVELRRGVAVDGKFYYRCHNSGETGEESCRTGEDNLQTLFENIKDIRATGRQTLVFLKSRPETIAAAGRFATYAALPPLPESERFALEAFADEESSALQDRLHDLFICGVAFHNADLTAGQRQAVEDGARAGHIRVIFATTTLATGINLPAAVVFIEPQKYCRHGNGSRADLQPLSWAEYESMSGRAGRVGWLEGHPDEPARAVLLAGSDLERSILWNYYVERHTEPLPSQLPFRNQADIVMDLFASGLAQNPKDCDAIIARSYAGHRNSLPSMPDERTYEQLLQKGFIIHQGERWLATPSGKAAAVTGLSMAGAEYFLEAGPRISSHSDLQLIYHLLHSPEGREIYLPGKRRAFRIHALDRLPDGVRDDDPLLAELAALRRELTTEESGRLRLTFLLADWIGGAPTREIEAAFHLYLGMIDSLARQTAWLFASAAAVIRAHDRFSPLPARYGRLAFSAAQGLPWEAKSLYGVLGKALFRGELLRLHEEGISGEDDLEAIDDAMVARIISSPGRFEMVKRKLTSIKEKAMLSIREAALDTTPATVSIEIDGTPMGERYLVRINGRPIQLTGKSFKYLVSLAWSRLTKDNGWVFKDELEQGFNQARYLYRLRQEIGRDFLPDWPLYENNRSGYYRLAAPRERITVNVEALREIPDYEIQRMATEIAMIGAS